MSNPTPRVGNWYQETSQGILFEVVAYDEEEDTIEVQYLEGEIEEYDLESWGELNLKAVAPPEDWRNGYELSDEDAQDPDETIRPDDWSDVLSRVEPDEIAAEDDFWAD